MKRFTLAVLVAVLPATVASQKADPKLDVKVLYAGVAGHARTTTWLTFLREHCAGASAIAMGDLNEKAAEGFDVVIVDSPSPYTDKGIKLPRGPQLTRAFTRPTVVLGAAGGSTLSGVDIKLDWL